MTDIDVEQNVKKMKYSEVEECKPLSSIENVLKYKTIFSQKKPHIFERDGFVISNSSSLCHDDSQRVTIDQRTERITTPKTLVCHDMKGGYLEDKFANGCDIGNGYTFYRWSNIDIFIYFSHHLVTIPPVGWIKVAHENNVKILGTFITEWENGEKICAKIFESEQTWSEFAKALVNICLFYNFDGWLLNIENKIQDTKPLVKFVGYLTNEMHKFHSESVVLWYDSVIQTGELKWQNELNDLNRCYFDACDGIFVNYTWKEEHLERSVMNAKERLLDVFIGVDVFGRNFFGGGGYNTHSALEVIRKHNLSAAIFAQGWTYETTTTEDKTNFFETFCRRDNSFWLSIYAYLYTHPVTDNFLTTFYLGSDQKRYNLSNQELVINRPAHCGSNDEISAKLIHKCDCIQLHMSGAKANTISYLISNPSVEKEKEHCYDLLKCSIYCKNSFLISYITKPWEKGGDQFYVTVLARNISGRYRNFKLVHEKMDVDDKYSIKPFSENSPHMSVIRENINFGNVSDGWEIRYYYVRTESPLKLLNIGGVLKGDRILLGGLAIKTDLIL